MTGRECFQAALNLLGEREEDAAYYEQFAPGAINQLLADCLRENNAQRQSRGLEPLAAAPRLTALDEELEIDEAAARECFPYGLAALLVCDDDREKFNWLSTEFAARMQYHCPAVQTEVKD